jgi:hypothetical protein
MSDSKVSEIEISQCIRDAALIRACLPNGAALNWMTSLISLLSAILDERQQAAKGVTDEMVRAACKSGMHELAEPSAVEMKRMRTALEAAMATLAKVEVPEGWKLVPIQPDERMLQALWEFGMRRASWNDVLSAAPSPKEGK